MGKTLTLRGRIKSGLIKRLIVDDGRLTHGVKVKAFRLLPVAPGTAATIVNGTLGLSPRFPLLQDFADNRQIGWCGTQSAFNPFQLIDPDHVVLNDLYVSAVSSTGEDVNYWVELETTTLSDYEAIVQLTKASSQDDLE